MTYRIETMGGSLVDEVRIEQRRGYWLVHDSVGGGGYTWDGRASLSEVLDRVCYDLGKNYSAPLRAGRGTR